MKKKKRAFLTGITGQDGSYLAELLLDKGYELQGIVRRSSRFALGEHSGTFVDEYEKLGEATRRGDLTLHYGDLADGSSLARLLNTFQPHEVYNLGAMSDVRVSFDCPEYTADITGTGALRVLEAARSSGVKDIKMYQASSSEVFGKVLEIPQKETTPFYPRSPYAASKVFAHWLCKNYRESYDMFVTSGILFNHESPRRGPNFVTRKITRGIANILAGRQDKIYLGNLDAKRDWGYAPEYVEAMWKMMQVDEPGDYVIATGETHSVQEFLDEACKIAGIDPKKHIEIKQSLMRPAEVDILIGDPTKAKEKLGWEPKVKFKELVKILLDADREAVEQEINGGRQATTHTTI